MNLEASDITVSINGLSIVVDASLKVCSGELVGLIGPNGAGKSTLLKSMLGIRPREAGSVTLNGSNYDEMPPQDRARQVAFLPQDRRVEWRLRTRDVVMLGRFPHRRGLGGPTPQDRGAVEKALGEVDALDLVDRPVSVLSGGERTRVLLARALAVEAPLLLADEPISALDPYHQLHVMEILRRLANEGCGVLAVIHDLALAARFMDRLILMSEGAVVFDGPPKDALSAERIAEVYHVEALRGEQAGRPWVLPWARSGQRSNVAAGDV